MLAYIRKEIYGYVKCKKVYGYEGVCELTSNTGIERETGLDARQSALLILSVLQLLMLAALYTGTVPHPPLRVTPFALGPFISASTAIALAAMFSRSSKAGLVMAAIAASTALVSYGPHKWFDPAFGDIWPAVITAQFAIVVIIQDLFRTVGGGSVGKPVCKQQ